MNLPELPHLSQEWVIPFDSLLLREVIRELAENLCGCVVQACSQTSSRDLHIRVSDGTRQYRLAIDISPAAPRMHLATRPAARRRAALPLGSAAHARLLGARLDSIEQVGFDRVATMRFSHPGEVPCSFTIAVELMGNRSNIVLLDSTNTVVECAVHVGHRINRYRETLPGRAYIPPPGLQDPPTLSAEEFETAVVDATTSGVSPSRAIRSTAPQLSPFLCNQLAEHFLQPGGAECIRTLWHAIIANERLQAYSYPDAGGAGAYPLRLSGHDGAPIASLNHEIDAGYIRWLEQRQVIEAQAAIRKSLTSEIEFCANTLSSIEAGLAQSAPEGSHTEDANLLLANFHRLRPGLTEIEVEDYYSERGSSRLILLRPEFSPQQNVDRYFEMDRDNVARKQLAVERQQKYELRLNCVAASLERLEKSILSGELADLSAVLTLREQLSKDGLVLRPNAGTTQESEFAGHRIRRVMTPEGYEILCGASSQANDYLTTRVAAPDDLWLHVRAAAGSHVVIRTRGLPDRVPLSVIKQAATLCAQNSSQKHSGLVAVDYTLKKYVRKPRKSAPGQVVIQREKTVHVSPKHAPELHGSLDQQD